MNKKLLFAAMSLVAFTACTDNDFESQQKVAEEVGSIQFEVINDAFTRASMNGDEVQFSAKDGDLFTLYHGGTLDPVAVTGYQNATYSAKAKEGEAAALTTPTMIKKGGAIMVWPVDTMRSEIVDGEDALTLKIPVEQGGLDANEKEIIQYQIPYVSDLIEIEPWAEYSETAAPTVIPTAYKTAGYNRKYQIFMRPMASQLNLKAIYDGMDDLQELVDDPKDPVEPISLTSVALRTAADGDLLTLFTKEIPIQFSAAPAGSQWGTVANNKWVKVTDFNIGGITLAGQTNMLTTKCLKGLNESKFLILPQAQMETEGKGVKQAAIIFDTYYGRVIVGDPENVADTKYSRDEIATAWYRYVSNVPATDADEEDGEHTDDTPLTIDGETKYKATSKPEFGLKQTINGFSKYKAKTGVAKGEPIGAAAIRYVVVYLNHLDMTNLHIKNDKQLRDVARVWDKLGLDEVTVYLDDDTEFESADKKDFHISQKTIKEINRINSTREFAKWFKVQPCKVAGEDITKIVITGSADEQAVQDIAFIEANDDPVAAAANTLVADVVLADEGDAKPWKWNGTVRVTATGVNQIINEGYMENAANDILATAEAGTPIDQNNIPFVNNNSWTIKSGTVNVQFDVTNYGKVTIAKGAQYRQDGHQDGVEALTVFRNQAMNKPTRFGGNDEEIGEVENKGVFATVGKGEIRNYGLIEHADKDAKTYITTNQTAGAKFSKAFGAATTANPGSNKMGRINLPYSNKDEDNISISADLAEGFVSVTVNTDEDDVEIEDGILNEDVVGHHVNYVIVNKGIKKIAQLPAQILYVEIDQAKTDEIPEIVWALESEDSDPVAEYVGLMVLSDVNIKLGTTINVSQATYLDDNADMYVGGTFTTNAWKGYYGDTTANSTTNYVTY